MPNQPEDQPQLMDVLYGIEIQGSAEFIKETKLALTILDRSNSFGLVTPYLGRIKEAKSSGMKAYDEPPTYDVGKETWQKGTMWYAGTIAHDAYHSFLYHQYKEKNDGAEPHPRVWTGAASEKKCLEYQLQVVQELGENEYVISYLEKVKENPTHQDVENRNW